MPLPRSHGNRPQSSPQSAWTLVALLALGTLFWLPRFQERLPGGPAPCPSGPAEPAPAQAGPPPEPGMKARLSGALGEARLLVLPAGALLERSESPEVRWVLCPLALVVGLSLAGLAGFRLRERLRRPKAALMYAISGLLGLALAFTSLRAATYSQSIRFASGTVEFETSELLGIRRTRRVVTGVTGVLAWRSTGRWSLYAVGAKPDPKGCSSILRARWVEPDLMAILNRSLR